MASPVSLAQLSRTGHNQVTVAFRYNNPMPGFDHAMILLCEQDGNKDAWTLESQSVTVGGFPLSVLDIRNASFTADANTAGPEDDVGGTGPGRRMRIVRMEPGWTTAPFRFATWQPDTDPGRDLEFYAVIAVVAVAAGLPVASLGSLGVTPTLRITF